MEYVFTADALERFGYSTELFVARMTNFARKHIAKLIAGKALIVLMMASM